MTTTDRSYRWLFWSLALLGFAGDQASKYGMFRWLDDGHSPACSHQVLEGSFSFSAHFQPTPNAPKAGVWHTLRTLTHERMPMVNHGALFGIGNDYQHLANGSFAIISILAAVGIMLWSNSRIVAGDRLLCVALGLILAGTLGNFYDRVIFGGVRDFLNFYLVGWPIFNVADCCLVVGASLMILQSLWAPNPNENRESQPGLLKTEAELQSLTEAR